ncbi:MAG TPA: Hsp20/alpha crystallin family protein [Opitutaceae bacterium]|nr:Hsp20/alpha crystallin family protein [Opitutaceae bacterium]
MSLLNSIIPSLNRTPAVEAAAPGLSHSIKPRHEIKETPEAWGVTVQLPGVAKAGLEITAEDGQLRIIGRRAWQQPEGWTTLYRESADAPFALVLAHDNAIDVAQVAAELHDGVLRISLPKHEAIKPRKIAVK